MINLPEDSIERCEALIDASKVRRWHAQPEIPIQTTGVHSFNMLLCLIALHPNPSANLMQAVIRHDLAERICSDFPHHMKKRFPVLKEIDEQMQAEFDEELNLTKIELTLEEGIWLKLLDQLEVLLYVQQEVSDPTTASWEIYENCATICNSYISQLQTFGYLLEYVTDTIQ